MAGRKLDNGELRGLCEHNPLALLLLTEREDINYVNTLFPLSIGMEIECNKKEEYNEVDKSQFQSYYKCIPTIMDVDTDRAEQRFRLPPGINGFICLAILCERLQIYSTLNMESGIHYHVDCTRSWDKIYARLDSELYMEDRMNIIKQLESWGYKGTFNAKYVSNTQNSHSWVRPQMGFKTLEFRIGEMSFDYKLIIKRILHLQQIVMNFATVDWDDIIQDIKPFAKNEFMDYFKNLKYDIIVNKVPKTIFTKPKQEDHKEVISRRIIKL